MTSEKIKRVGRRIAAAAVPLLALLSTLLLPQLYIRLGWLQNAMDRVLHVKVDPIYTGGETLATFIDRPGDDRGEGGLTYPLHPSFQTSGCLDILRYTVHHPVTDARLDNPRDFWQLDITLARMDSAGLSQAAIHIYLDIDGRASGRLDTALPRSELVRFSPDHPWDFFIHVDGYTGGSIVSADRTYERKVEVLSLESKHTVLLRLPLDHPRLISILDGHPTFHYVLVGGCDPLAPGGFLRVEPEAGMRCGGGARSTLTPRVYDYLEPRGTDQKKILSSYREESLEWAQLEPVEVKAEPAGTDEERQALMAKFQEEAKRESKEQNPAHGQEEIQRLEKMGAAPGERLQAYFAAGRMDEAERIAREILEKNPNDAIALAHLASLTGMRANRASSLSQASARVNQALTLYREASKQCQTEDQRLVVLLHASSLEMAIPDSVFHQSAAAARHLLEAVEILERQSPRKEAMIAGCIHRAALAYEQAEDPANADSCWIRLASLPRLAAKVKVQLLERGYIPLEK